MTAKKFFLSQIKVLGAEKRTTKRESFTLKGLKYRNAKGVESKLSKITRDEDGRGYKGSVAQEREQKKRLTTDNASHGGGQQEVNGLDEA